MLSLRRKTLLLATLLAVASGASAQANWPSRTVRLLVPFPPAAPPT